VTLGSTSGAQRGHLERQKRCETFGKTQDKQTRGTTGEHFGGTDQWGPQRQRRHQQAKVSQDRPCPPRPVLRNCLLMPPLSLPPPHFCPTDALRCSPEVLPSSAPCLFFQSSRSFACNALHLLKRTRNPPRKKQTKQGFTFLWRADARAPRTLRQSNRR